MIDLAFLVAFLGLPALAYALVRSVTWIAVATGAAFAIFGALVTFVIERGFYWTLRELQLLVLVAALSVLTAAWFQRRRGNPPAISGKRQLLTVFGPVLLGFVLLAAIRLYVAPRAGLFTAVGFLVARADAEDNAKWLDFTAQLITGHDIVQGVAMGGPLQLYLVVVSTALAAISAVALGGVNEVFVASNAVVYGQYAMAIIAPFALAPLVETRLRRGRKSDGDRLIPAPLVLTGTFILFAASLAVSGLGHLTLQFSLLVIALWVAVFVVGASFPRMHLYASLAAASAALVWFPLSPIALVVVVAGVVVLVMGVRRAGFRSYAAPALAWAAFTVLAGGAIWGATKYMAAPDATTAAGASGGVRGVVAAVHAEVADLLNSRGGTQEVGPMLGILVAAVVVLGVHVVVSGRVRQKHPAVAMVPLTLLAAYAMVITVPGTWYVGSGPNYGALKTTFLVSIVALAVLTPIALAGLDSRRTGMTVLRWTGIAAIIYVMAVDTILPRAFVYVSPHAWPSASGDSVPAYWAPAEVQRTGSQSIASNPIACAFRPQGAIVPTALPDGKRAYSCTRILVGLGGADATGQALPDWLRREWFANEGAWDNEWTALSNMPDDLRRRNIILMDDYSNVIGLEPVQYFLDRQKPPWAQ